MQEGVIHSLYYSENDVKIAIFDRYCVPESLVLYSPYMSPVRTGLFLIKFSAQGGSASG